MHNLRFYLRFCAFIGFVFFCFPVTALAQTSSCELKDLAEKLARQGTENDSKEQSIVYLENVAPTGSSLDRAFLVLLNHEIANIEAALDLELQAKHDQYEALIDQFSKKLSETTDKSKKFNDGIRATYSEIRDNIKKSLRRQADEKIEELKDRIKNYEEKLKNPPIEGASAIAVFRRNSNWIIIFNDENGNKKVAELPSTTKDMSLAILSIDIQNCDVSQLAYWSNFTTPKPVSFSRAICQKKDILSRFHKTSRELNRALDEATNTHFKVRGEDIFISPTEKCKMAGAKISDSPRRCFCDGGQNLRDPWKQSCEMLRLKELYDIGLETRIKALKLEMTPQIGPWQPELINLSEEILTRSCEWLDLKNGLGSTNNNNRKIHEQGR